MFFRQGLSGASIGYHRKLAKPAETKFLQLPFCTAQAVEVFTFSEISCIMGSRNFQTDQHQETTE
jgi:hypothetical protein